MNAPMVAAPPGPHARPAPAAMPALVDEIVERSRMVRAEGERAHACSIVETMFAERAAGRLGDDGIHLGARLDRRIAEIDRLLSAGVSAVLHHPRFQQLEAAWRGVDYLCRHTATGSELRIKILPVRRSELVHDFESAIEFDQSALFKRIYEEEYGSFGGAPFGALIGDFAMTRSPQDVRLLEHLAHVAAAAHAPFIAGAAPELFGLDDFTELGRPRDLAKAFDTADYARWHALRGAEDARYVGLALPRFLGRLPYAPRHGTTVEGFCYDEEDHLAGHADYLWINAAFALGVRLTQAFEKHGWCAAIRGVEGGGLVSGLPVHTFRASEGDTVMKCPTEVAITDRRERELAQLGFIALVHRKHSDHAAFFGTPSLQKPRRYDTPEANANAQLSTQLQYMFAVCRIAHYLKSIMRDKVGSFASADQVEAYLARWIAGYVTTDDHASQEAKASFPLREASIRVTDHPDRPGSYRAVAFVRPHFQLDELTVSLRLVAQLPGPSH